jgi:SAM-dependent methyltransferase
MVQEKYEDLHNTWDSIDSLDFYLDEIDSVKEIYTREFGIMGKVLDVGGGQGRLRHFLSKDKIPLYVCVDPFITVFNNIDAQSNLLRAYPCLSDPCPFVVCHAEFLPFRNNSFDWVHLRSVLDHFSDPYLAIKEAYRVLGDAGTILLGLTVTGGNSSLKDTKILGTRPSAMVSRVKEKIKRDGLKGLSSSLIGRLSRLGHGKREQEVNDHTFHWHYADLCFILKEQNFQIKKEHWQKPPFDMCVYMSATKKVIS